MPLITRAIRNCRAAGVFDAIWVNSEHPAFGEIAAAEGVHFHRRPEALGNNQATSEQFVAEFLQAHDCDTAWRRRTYLDAVAAGQCATDAGRVGFHPISALAGHIIKTERDLQIAEALLGLVEDD